MTERYVALGSSMAAGPGIPPRDKKAPLRAARSAANCPHLVARRIGLDLVDVTYSGATTAHVLTDRQNDEPPQVNALDGSEALVTVEVRRSDSRQTLPFPPQRGGHACRRRPGHRVLWQAVNLTTYFGGFRRQIHKRLVVTGWA